MANTDPVAAAAAHYEPRFAAAQAHATALEQATDDFLMACRRCDANALATFAPLIKDYEASRKLQSVDAHMPMRYESLTEVMQCALDYSNGPSMTELMQLLLNVAYGADLAAQRPLAHNLLQRMASKWASMNTEEA